MIQNTPSTQQSLNALPMRETKQDADHAGLLALLKLLKTDFAKQV